MSHTPTLSIHYSHYLFHSSYTTVLVPLHYGLCTIFSYHSSIPLILFYTVPTCRFLRSHAFPVSDTVHALPVFYLRYSPSPLYLISRQYSWFYIISSFGLRCRTWLWGETGKERHKQDSNPRPQYCANGALTTKLLCPVKLDYNPS